MQILAQNAEEAWKGAKIREKFWKIVRLYVIGDNSGLKLSMREKLWNLATVFIVTGRCGEHEIVMKMDEKLQID